jgi:hypothetical protein
MEEKQDNVLSNLIELAKDKYGEYKEELIGYELGYYDGFETHWSDEIVPLDKLKSVDDFYGSPSSEDIENRRLSNAQYYWYGDNNQYCIAKIVKVLNKGWKTELLNLIINL